MEGLNFWAFNIFQEQTTYLTFAIVTNNDIYEFTINPIITSYL